MTQDYARSTTNKRDNHKNPFIRHKNKGVVLCLLAGAFALYKYSSVDFNQIQKSVAKNIEIEQSRPKQLPKPKFEFYTRLPKNNTFTAPASPKKKLPKANVSSLDAKPIIANANNYLIQIASFKKFSEAENLRARLIMQGHNAYLSQFKNSTNTWFRVEIGPFNSLQQAKRQQFTLEKLSYNGLIKRVT